MKTTLITAFAATATLIAGCATAGLETETLEADAAIEASDGALEDATAEDGAAEGAAAESAEAEAGDDAMPEAACYLEDAAGDFDFWLGLWDVSVPSGEEAGVNSISSLQDGCILWEQWDGASGFTGQSWNFYDPLAEGWRQIWMSESIFIDMVGNLDEDGAMFMEGDIHYYGAYQAPFRGKWTFEPETGHVLQEFWEMDDEGEWADWFAGVYVPAELDK